MKTISTILTATLFGVATATAAIAGTAQASSKNVVETAVAAGDFKTLAKALEAADLVSSLSGTGRFTVFAPTDAAFAKLPPGTLDALLEPENKAKLQAVLQYHVVSGDVRAADVVKLDSAKTLQGGSLPIAVSGGSVTVAGATVVQTDVVASNGVIHVIDRVMLPPGM